MRVPKETRQAGAWSRLAVLVFIAALAGDVTAAKDEFPACDPQGTQVSDEVSEAIHEQAQRMTDAACNASAMAAYDSSGIFAGATVTKMNASCDRAQKWVQAEGRKCDLAGRGTKHSASCSLVELEGNGLGNDDGVCSQDERYTKHGQDESFGCAVATADDLNNNQVCDYDRSKGSGGRKVWEKCLQVCDVPSDNPNVIDCAALEHMHGSFKDVADNLELTNTLFEGHLAALQARQPDAMVQDAEPGQGGACKTAAMVDIGGPLGGYTGDGRKNSFDLIYGLFAGKEAADIAAQVCLAAADTTAFGFDVPAACIPAFAALGIVEGFAESAELLDDTITGTRVDNMSKCMQEMGTQLDDMEDQLGLMEEQLGQIINLLNTPQGRRPDFPQ